MGVGLLIGLLTFFYWRHTRPLRYMTALDALADVEQKVPKAGTDVPTAEQPVIGTGKSATTAAVGATTAVRILEDKDTSTSAAADDETTVGPDPDAGRSRRTDDDHDRRGPPHPRRARR